MKKAINGKANEFLPCPAKTFFEPEQAPQTTLPHCLQ